MIDVAFACTVFGACFRIVQHNRLEVEGCEDIGEFVGYEGCEEDVVLLCELHVGA